MVGPYQTPDDSTLFEILSHRRRRYALDLMTGTDRAWSVTELATEITDLERDGPPVTGQRGRIDDVRIPLYHAHLPKLAAAGLVDFDRERKTATLTPTAGAIDQRLFSATPNGATSVSSSD